MRRGPQSFKYKQKCKNGTVTKKIGFRDRQLSLSLVQFAEKKNTTKYSRKWMYVSVNKISLMQVHVNNFSKRLNRNRRSSRLCKVH